jgi:hypothetical protein
MDVKLLFDFVSTFLWSLLLAYGAYLQRELSVVHKKKPNTCKSFTTITLPKSTRTSPRERLSPTLKIS